MKKRLIITVISSCFAFMTISAQEKSQNKLAQNKYTCFVKIETTTGDILEAALDKFTADSVFIAPVEEKYVKAGGKYIKILNEESEIGIAVNEIRSLKIKYEPNIIHADELNIRIKQLRRQNAGKIVGITLLSAAYVVVVIPLSVVSGTPDALALPFELICYSNGTKNVSVSGNNLMVTKHYKSFTLNGNDKKYVKMVKQLTKSKTDPFENSLAKN